MMRGAGLFVCATLATSSAWAGDCYEQAGERYGLGADILHAIAIQESGGRNDAININLHADGSKSEDVCAMQINTFWLPKLASYGIQRHHLLSDFCTCVHAGAWILAQEVQRVGYTWRAVAYYHTGANPAREAAGMAYAGSVEKHFNRIRRNQNADRFSGIHQ